MLMQATLTEISGLQKTKSINQSIIQTNQKDRQGSRHENRRVNGSRTRMREVNGDEITIYYIIYYACMKVSKNKEILT